MLSWAQTLLAPWLCHCQAFLCIALAKAVPQCQINARYCEPRQPTMAFRGLVCPEGCLDAAGAAADGISDNEQFIPCHNGLDCSTATLPHKNYSIIAGHFTWRELQRVGLIDFDCIVSVRRPVERVMSCLSFFYPRKVMETMHGMSRCHYSITRKHWKAL